MPNDAKDALTIPILKRQAKEKGSKKEARASTILRGTHRVRMTRAHRNRMARVIIIIRMMRVRIIGDRAIWGCGVRGGIAMQARAANIFQTPLNINPIGRFPKTSMTKIRVRATKPVDIPPLCGPLGALI